MDKNKLFAIVGMCGSGKSIASDYLEEIGFNKIYFGGVTMSKLKEEGLEINPENEKMMREKLRREYGMGAFAILLLPEIKESIKKQNTVLDGVYSYDEVKILKENFDNLKIISIICDKNIRYDRLSVRKIRPFNYEEAEKRDISEVENIAKAPPIAMADYYVLNNSSIEEYKQRLDEIIRKEEK